MYNELTPIKESSFESIDISSKCCNSGILWEKPIFVEYHMGDHEWTKFCDDVDRVMKPVHQMASYFTTSIASICFLVIPGSMLLFPLFVIIATVVILVMICVYLFLDYMASRDVEQICEKTTDRNPCLVFRVQNSYYISSGKSRRCKPGRRIIVSINQDTVTIPLHYSIDYSQDCSNINEKTESEIRKNNNSIGSFAEGMTDEFLLMVDPLHKDSNNNKFDPFKSFFHEVKYGDTLNGICLRYNITVTQLRQANNGFSGSNLSMAPSILKIPVDPETVIGRPLDSTEFVVSKEMKIRTVIHALNEIHDNKSGPSKTYSSKRRRLSPIEAKCYLEMNDWDVDKAIAEANQDFEFEAG